MKRYNVNHVTAFEDVQGDWVSYNQVVELLHFLCDPPYSKKQIIDLIKNYKPTSKVW